MKHKLTLIASLVLSTTAFANGYSYSPWLNRIGVTPLIQSQSLGGSGMILGIVDTGITDTSGQFTGRIASTSSCAVVSSYCTSYVDDTKHGTAVAAIAAGGILNKTGVSVVGVAPNATLLIEKAFMNGQAYNTDFANGIVKAVNGGASVVNLSGTYNNSTTLVNAINYAASKGVYVVFSGGNNNTSLLNGANTVGLTPQAVKHLVLVGSLMNAVNTKASWSNIPGSGSLVDTSGVRTSYASNWLVTPGEYIIAPSGSNYSYWSGTSFSAPMVSGSLILLESTWKILKTNSTAAELLFKTATKIGTSDTYGNGELNLTKAFAPYGNLMITQANGVQVIATSLTTSMVSSGALGSLPSVTSKLSNINSFDSYTRNYSVNLSNLIATPTNKNAVATLATMNPTPIVTRFNDSTVSFSTSDASDKNWFALTNTDTGFVFGTGYGYAFNSAYAKAFYLNVAPTYSSASLNVANSLVSLANGGDYFAFGAPVGGGVRAAFASVETAPVPFNSIDWLAPTAKGFMVGVSKNFDDVLVGVSVGTLQEEHGVLGTTYNNNSALSFGNNKSSTIGLSIGYTLDEENSFLFESAVAKVTGNDVIHGIVMGTSDIIATSVGLSYTRANAFNKDDSFTFTVKSPLRVNSGTTTLFTQDIDENGVPFDKPEVVSLVPNGMEVSYLMSYSTPLSKTSLLSFDFSHTKDVNNIADSKETSLKVRYNLSFN